MNSPAIGSRWRSKRNGDIGTVVAPGYGTTQLRMDYPSRKRWLRLTKSGRPCGYEPVEEVERE